jgi:hypothetical protein
MAVTASSPVFGEFKILCDSIALVYHESRNVRHLVRQNLLDQQPWRFVVSLPTGSDDAWRVIRPLRDKAFRTQSAGDAQRVFKTRFQVSLQDLVLMFEDENWRHAKFFGGNAWAGITKLTIQLANTLQSENIESACEMAILLRTSRHNTGTMEEKLFCLDRS